MGAEVGDRFDAWAGDGEGDRVPGAGRGDVWSPDPLDADAAPHIAFGHPGGPAAGPAAGGPAAQPAPGGPSAVGAALAIVAAALGVIGAGLLALVAFVGAGAGVAGHDGAYDGWAWAALVVSLGAPMCALLPGIVLRAADREAEEWIVLVVAGGVTLAIGFAIAWVAVGVLIG